MQLQSVCNLFWFGISLIAIIGQIEVYHSMQIMVINVYQSHICNNLVNFIWFLASILNKNIAIFVQLITNFIRFVGKVLKNFIFE